MSQDQNQQLQQISQALQRSELRFRRIFNSSPVMMTITRASDGVFVQVNEAFCRTLGYRQGQILGKSSLELGIWWSPPDRALLIQALETSGPIQQTLLSFRSRGGHKLVVLWSGEVIELEGERCILGFAIDVSSRVESQKALMQSEQRYKQLVQTLPHGVAELDLQGGITFSNAAHNRMYGYQEGELVGRCIYDFPAEADNRTKLEKYFQQLVASQPTPEPYFSTNLKKDGSSFDIRVDWDYKRDEAGFLNGFTVVVTDITQQNQALAALKENEERFRSTFEQAPIGIIYGGLHGDIRWGNRKVFELFGYPEQDLWKLKVNKVTHPDDMATVELWKQLQAGELDHYRTEKRYLRADGSTMWAVVNVSTVQSDSGEPKHFIVLIEDVSERKQVEEELRRAHEELEQRVKERTRELEDTNTALTVLLDHRDKERQDLETNIAASAGRIISPFIDRLRVSGLTGEQKTLLDIIASALDEVVSPYAQKLSSKLYGLTPREMEVATLIRKGLANAEVADLMSVSENAVAFHRQNIRKKLGLKGTKVNLTNYLQQLPEK